MAFLGALALMGADPAQAYQQSRSRQQQLDQADIEQQASVALGQGMGALAQLGQLGGGGPLPGGGQPPPGVAGGQQPPVTPQGSPPVQFASQGAPMPGQMPAPTGTPPGAFSAAGPMGSTFSQFGQRDNVSGPSAMLGPSPLQNKMQPMGGPPGGAPAGPPPQAGGMPHPPHFDPAGTTYGAGGGGQPQGQGQPSMTPGMMDLPTLAAVIQRANPGIKPEVFAHALQQGAKLLSPFAQTQLREMMMQLAMGRQQMAGRREDRADRRETRLEAQQAITSDTKLQSLELQRKRLEIGLNNQTMKAYHDTIWAKHLAIQEHINARTATGDEEEAKAMLKEEDDRYQAEVEAMMQTVARNKPAGGAAPQPAKSGPAAKTADKKSYPVPKEYADKKDGFKLQDEDGNHYVKKGNQVVPE